MIRAAIRRWLQVPHVDPKRKLVVRWVDPVGPGWRRDNPDAAEPAGMSAPHAITAGPNASAVSISACRISLSEKVGEGASDKVGPTGDEGQGFDEVERGSGRSLEIPSAILEVASVEDDGMHTGEDHLAILEGAVREVPIINDDALILEQSGGDVFHIPLRAGREAANTVAEGEGSQNSSPEGRRA